MLLVFFKGRRMGQQTDIRELIAQKIVVLFTEKMGLSVDEFRDVVENNANPENLRIYRKILESRRH